MSEQGIQAARRHAVAQPVAGQRPGKLSVRSILKLDAAFYSGVTLMVGFWLAIGEVATPLSAWLAFASSYAAIVAVEPLLTLLLISAIARRQHSAAVRLCFQPQAV